MEIMFLAFLTFIFSNLGQGEGCSDSAYLLSNLPGRSIHINTQATGITVSDDTLTEGWYRTYDAGKQYFMADINNIPSLASCGTLYPIYMSAMHPNMDLYPDGGVHWTTSRCMRTDISICNSSSLNVIRRCGDEIQYWLYPTAKYAGYCFDLESIDESENDLSAVALAFIVAACCLTVCGTVVLGYMLKRYCEKDSDDSHPFVLPINILRNRVYPSSPDDVPDLPTFRSERYNRKQADDSDSPPPFWKSVRDENSPNTYTVMREAENNDRGTDATPRETVDPLRGTGDRVHGTDDIVLGNDDISRATDGVDRNDVNLVRDTDNVVRGTDNIVQETDDHVRGNDATVQRADKLDIDGINRETDKTDCSDD